MPLVEEVVHLFQVVQGVVVVELLQVVVAGVDVSFKVVEVVVAMQLKVEEFANDLMYCFRYKK